MVIGNALSLAGGVSGQVLTSNGASTPPTFQDAAAGTARALTFVTSTNITGSPTTITFTGLTQSLYFFVFRNVIFGDTFSADRRMFIRISDDNGATWKSGASDYAFAYTGRLAVSGALGGNNTASTSIETAFSSTDTDTDPNTGAYAEIFMQNANTASRKPIIFGQTYSGDGDVSIFNGRYNTAAAVNGIQFLLTTGTFDSGTVYQYYITEG